MNTTRRPRIVHVILVLLAAVALATAACGGGDDGGDGGNGNGDTGGGGDGGAEPVSVSVSAADFSFDPSEVSVPAGAEVTVTFENTGEAPHTMTSDDVNLNAEADPGDSVEATFTAPESGSVEFHCEIHPDMTGEIVVDGSAASGDKDKEDKSGGYDY